MLLVDASLIFPDPDAEAMVLPSGEKLTLLTPWECPSKVLIFLPVVISHSFIVLPPDAEAIVLSSGEKLILLTADK